MEAKHILLICGVALILMGIYFLATYIRENTKEYTLVHGKITEVIRHLRPGRHRGITYTPIIQYQYRGSTYETEHRISSPTSGLTYKVNDVVELRVYEDRPDNAIINSKRNLMMPLIVGAGFVVLGVILLIIYSLIFL